MRRAQILLVIATLVIPHLSPPISNVPTHLVEDILNMAPIADCGDNRMALVGESIHFDGSLSRDPDNTTGWIVATPLPTARRGLGAGFFEGRLYTFGGGLSNLTNPMGNMTEIFDPIADEWSVGSPMPTARDLVSVAHLQNRFYVIGGVEPDPAFPQGMSSDDVEVYDPTNDTWEIRGHLPRRPNQGWAASVATDDTIVVVMNDGLTYMYDPISDNWTQKASVPVIVNGHAIVAYKGLVYLFGGGIVPGGVSNQTWIYDPDTDAWMSGPPMPTARRRHTATIWRGEIYVLGGTPTAYDPLDIIEIFNPSLGTWRTEGNLPTPRLLLASTASDDTLFTVGGQDYLYDPVSSNEMLTARLNHVWDFGDGSSHGKGVTQTHIYDNPGIYNVTLTVTDTEGAAGTDNCIITVLEKEDQPPIADAGPDQTVYEGDVVQFDGTGSYDPDAGWVTTTVDTLVFQNVWASMALDGRDFPGIGYYNVTDRELRYAKWNGTMWEYATVDSLASSSSLAFNGSDYPSMSYHDGDNRDLKYAWWNGTGWNNMTVDSLGMVGVRSTLAIDDDDHPHISYHDSTNQDLKYAWWNGTAWLNETVDWFGLVGGGSSLVFDRHGNPHISYSGELKIGNQVYYPLKYAWKNGSVWDIQFVSVDPSIAYTPSLALDRNDFAHISHYEGVGGGLVYTHWNGTAWNMETVDQTTGPLAVGGYPSLALDSSDYPHISYLDAKNGTVKHTFWNGTTWIIETVDNANFGTTSLAIDGNDSPHMSYFSGADFDLKYAKKGGGIVSYNWDFGDGSPHETGARPTHVYGDNGNYTVTLKVTDNAGLSDTDTCIITVLNVAPTADANGLYQGFEGTPVHFEGNHTDPGANDTHTYEWDFNYDGTIFTPDVTGNPSQKTWYDDYSGNIALRITDDDGGWDLDVTAVTVANVPPRAEAGEDMEGFEVSTFTFNGSFYDPGANDTHEYAWDFDYDGISFDVEATGQSVTHTFVDDFDGDIALRVTDDDSGVGIDTTHVLVKNVPPTVTLKVLPIEVNAFLRIAGEKWHDVSIELFEDGSMMANGTLVRYPGSPNDQMLDLTSLQFDYSKKYSATIRYTPDDDPINGQPNGANPCWIILKFSDGQELWIHHTFNVQHPDTYVWEVDLTAAILSHGMTFKATASDPGADELTFHWDFGDGTNATSFYPNGNGTYPVTIMEIINHVFPGSGTYVVVLTVEDDDGGVGVAMVTVVIP